MYNRKKVKLRNRSLKGVTDMEFGETHETDEGYYAERKSQDDDWIIRKR